MYEVQPCHTYFIIVYVPTGTVVYSGNRRCDVVRKFNRFYAAYNTKKGA